MATYQWSQSIETGGKAAKYRTITLRGTQTTSNNSLTSTVTVDYIDVYSTGANGIKFYLDGYIYLNGTEVFNSTSADRVNYITLIKDGTASFALSKTPVTIDHETNGTASFTVEMAPNNFSGFFFVNNNYTDSQWKAVEDKVYTVSAQPITVYTIAYQANGGSGSTASQTVIAGQEVTLRSNGFSAPSGILYETILYGNGGKNGTPTYGANAFYRWRLNSTSGTLYKAGDTYTPTGNTTFYAQWYTPTTLGTTTRDNSTNPGYTITFDATTNGGICNTASLTVSNPVSHTFKNWNSASNGSGATWDDTTAVYQITSKIELYAQWESTETLGTINLPTASKSSTNAQNRTVTLNYNDGSGKIETKTSTATITHTFQGWSTSATASTGSTGTYKPTSSHKLYAIFKGTTGTYSAVSLPSPTRTGYTFEGWGTSASATSGATGSYTPSGDITLYAIWKAKGAVRIYIDGQGYRMAQVYLYANNKWNLTIPYLYDGSWRIST